MTGVICPTYQSGFYSPDRGGRAKYPQLWRGRKIALATCLGPTGLVLRDHSGNGNHGTLNSMAPATDWIVNGGAYALSVTTSGDNINCGAAKSCQISGDITVAFWFNAQSTFGVWASHGDANPGWFVQQVGANQVKIKIADINRTSTATAFTAGVWYLFAWSQSGGNGVLWIGKAADTTFTSVPAASASTADLLINQYTSGGFNSAIYFDDFGIWDRGLTYAELSLLSRRRGIAYELDRNFRAKAPAAAAGSTSGNLLLLGVG